MRTEVTANAIELVRSFVNTLDREDGVDILDRGWLADQGLLTRTDDVDAGELRRLAEVREAIRVLLLANNGIAVDRAPAAATIDAAAVVVGLSARFRPDGTGILETSAAGVAGATGRILGAVVALQGTDAWSRLKVCRWDECRWAFYDEARNRSRAWCSMAACGNRAKARAYRARH
jgi:predicted RNA-binding Zn ribbon-like protein